MKTWKKILSLVLILLVVTQFIQPKKNRGETNSENDITKAIAVPIDLHQMLVKKCYDCHSNNTQYPWYANVQPIGWWLAAHVHDGKEELNFSEFKTYDAKRANHKLEEIGEVVEAGEMPLKAYTILHKGSEVTPEEVTKIKGWLASLGVKEEH